MLIELVDMKVKNVMPYMVFGSLAVIFGVVIYYGLPLAMLKLNFGLILTIFFLILMSLLLGLVLFSVNLQGAIERALLHLLLFWEKKSMKLLLAQNITAHKRTNQLTAIIYALTLGCIIFLLTSASLQIETINTLDTIDGADIVVEGAPDQWMDTPFAGKLFANLTDPVLQQYAGSINSFAYISGQLKAAESGNEDAKLSQLSRMSES